MDIKRDFQLEFDEQTYFDFHGERMARLLERPSVRSQFEQAMAEAAEVVQPAACFSAFSIKRFMHERVELVGGARLGGGPFTEVIGGAEQLILAVCTVGNGVDARLKELQKEGQRFTVLVLDELATWAVDQIRQQLCRQFEAEQRSQGSYTSTVLSPGESAWSVSDQSVIFDLLNTSVIDVTLSPGMVMYPLKSLSMAMGIGPSPMGQPGLTNCDYCSMKDRCKYVRLGGHAVASLS
ncbi:MAG: hypothetical protein GY759_18450 [Chloroflexi bacterium]|nr:hypothetical protein [Chloroflexota bacterium]